MNLESEILKEHSKRQIVKIGTWVGNNPARFAKLMDLFLHGDRCITQRAAWAMSYCIDRRPELAAPWLGQILKKMQEPDVHVAVIRNGVHILQFVDIPRSLLGTVVTLCFGYLSDPKSPIAARAYAMTVLANAVKREPGLVRELQTGIELMLPDACPALRSRGRTVLKRLRKI